MISITLSLAFEYFASGRNNYGQLGLNTDVSQINTFTQLTDFIDDDFIEINLGKQHVVAVTDNGKVYGWGDNQYHQISTDELANNLSTKPLEMSFFSDNHLKAARADAGRAHSVVLTQDHRVFTWGLNLNNQLGRKTSNSRSDPTPG